MTIPLSDMQQALKNFGMDGWLMYDFRGINPLARRILKLEDGHLQSRRWFYYIPQSGTPAKLVHAIEADALDHLPGEKFVYLSYQELQTFLKTILKEPKKIAGEYVAMGNNPYISRLDGGTIDMIRACDVELVSSGDLIQQFEAVLDESQLHMHLDAAHVTRTAFHAAWDFMQQKITQNGYVDEVAVQEVILSHFESHKCTTYSPPIVAVNANAGLPHYETGTGTYTRITKGDLVLIDLWAKLKKPNAIYSDLTCMAYIGELIPEKLHNIFQVVIAGRDAAFALVQDRFAAKTPVYGWELDHITRETITKAGYGHLFTHRTGHNLGQEVHGNGAHLDSIETRDERQILPSTLFTIEPGIYNAPENYGFRSEINVFITAEGEVQETGGIRQYEIERIHV
jgi:Xaa-Pro aminopeptidase